MRKSNYVLLGLFLFQICSFSQSQDFNNGNLENVNAVWINDPGPEEGIKWLGTSSNWNIDVSPEDRTNADGNLNIYGTSNRIVLWRPTVIKGDISYLFLSSNDAPDGNRNWYHAVGNDGSYVLNIANDNYQWTKSILKVKRNGNLGIGVSDPMTKLSIYGSIAEGWNSGIELNREGGGKGWIVVDGDGMKFKTPVDGDGFYFRDNDNNTSFFIKDGGNAFLNGKFEAKEIKVQIAPTADFVFNDNYDLKGIDEVEKFIKENKHLPDFPSGKEIEENGVNLGEMDAKLLQKIEELTLYTIEQEKAIEELKKQNSKILKLLEEK